VALTEAQRATVRLVMGWPSRWHQTSNELEQSMSALDSSPEDLARVLLILPKIADIDTRITAALGCVRVAEAGTVRMKDDNGLSLLRREGRRLVNQLSSELGCPKGTDYFGTGRGFAGNNALTYG
jgi:hypothetical protein